jgi:hypothetical protein
VIHLEAAHSAFSRFLPQVPFEIEEGVLRLELELSGRRLTGTVHDEAGRPVRSARVTALPESSRIGVSTLSGVDGQFELVGLEGGPLKLAASARDIGSSEWVRVGSQGEGPSPETLLVLKRGRLLEGVVTTGPSDFLAGARVSLTVLGPQTRLVSDVTNISGHFEVHIPDMATQAVVQVFSPRLNWSACLPLPPAEEPMVINLPSTFGGAVYLEQGERSDPTAETVLVNDQGGLFILGQLLSFGDFRRIGDGYLIPSMAPGFYGLIESSTVTTGLATLACARALPVEEWQPLTEGQELRFDLNR